MRSGPRYVELVITDGPGRMLDLRVVDMEESGGGPDMEEVWSMYPNATVMFAPCSADCETGK